MYCCWSWHGRNCRLVFLKVEGWYVSKTTCLMWEKIVLDLKVWFNSNCWADLYNASHPSWSFYPKIYTPAAWKMMQKWRCIFLQRMGIFHEGIPTVVFFPRFPLPFSQESTRPCERRLYLEARWAFSESFTQIVTLMTRKMTLRRKGKERWIKRYLSGVYLRFIYLAVGVSFFEF